MTDILTEIIACKQIEIELQKAAISKEMLINNCNEPMPRISMRASLASSLYGIISEFKRRSPSKGWIKEDAQADTIPPAYEAAGASALSILTDEKYFGGSLKDIRSARPHVQLPILRKDFIIDEYQLYQARIVGADAILLIAAALKKEQCKALALKAHELELEVLLEIHNEQELEYIDENIDMVGVNNRNLGSFHTEVENSFRLAEKLPEEMLRISESGISSPETVKQLRAAGFRGFLIGEGQVEEMEAVNNPEDPSAGTHTIEFSRELWIERDDFMEDAPKKYFRMTPGQEVRLKSGYIVKCTGCKKDDNGNVVEVYCEYDPDSKTGMPGSNRKIKGTIHWVSCAHCLPAEVRLYDRLWKVENPRDEMAAIREAKNCDALEAMKEMINPDSLNVLTNCYVEKYLADAKPLDYLQFQRIGYFNVDKDSTPEHLVFNRTVSLKDTWSKINK